MKIPRVALHEWKGLYDAAERFRRLAPWKMFYDSDMFGFRDPETGETGYACILGNLGEVFALCVYRGAEGYDAHRRIQSGKITPESDDSLSAQNCLIAQFTDREDLEKEDMKVIEPLGLSFSGANSWPSFRSYLPGYFPWHLTSAEARFLTLALEGACVVTQKVVAGSIDLHERPGRHPIYSSPSATEIAKGNYETIWEEHPVYRPPMPQPFQLNESDMASFRSLDFAADSPWDADSFYLFTPVMDGDRPYLPRVSLIVHHASGFIFHSEMAGPERMSHQALGDALLATLRKHRLKPETVYLKDDAMVKLLRPLGEAVGITLKSRKNLLAIQDVRDNFIEWSRGNRG